MKEEKNMVIWSEMPDGTNFFLGVKEVPMETKSGKIHPMKMNIWDDFTEVREGQGLFTETEAEFYVNEIIGMGGVFISTYQEAKEKRDSKFN